MTPTKQILKKFKILCRECNSENIEVYFYAGFITDQGGDTGVLDIKCIDCGILLNIDDD